MVAAVINHLLPILEEKSKVKLISEISEIFVFSYLALGQIRKLGNLGKSFLSFRNFWTVRKYFEKVCVTISVDRNEELGMTCLLGNDLMLFLILSGKQRLESLEIDDFQSGHVEHMLNQHGSVLIVTGKSS